MDLYRCPDPPNYRDDSHLVQERLDAMPYWEVREEAWHYRAQCKLAGRRLHGSYSKWLRDRIACKIDYEIRHHTGEYADD